MTSTSGVERRAPADTLHVGKGKAMDRNDYFVDLREGSQSALEALAPLQTIDLRRSFHERNGLRQPLGIYNVSITRVTSKLLSCISRMESYWRAPTVDLAHDNEKLRTELIDYVELLLYASFEHVEDLESIVNGFYENRRDRTADPFMAKLRSAKRFIATAANSMKHAQARIRLYSVQMEIANERDCLHGFFVEGVTEGVVGPYQQLHEEFPAYSLSGLAWEVIAFLLRTSRALATFLYELRLVLPGPADARHEAFDEGFIAATRLPMFTFGEPFALADMNVRLANDDRSAHQMTSRHLGSFNRPWRTVPGVRLTQVRSEYEGDGTTRTFRLFQPPVINFHHWN